MVRVAGSEAVATTRFGFAAPAPFGVDGLTLLVTRGEGDVLIWASPVLVGADAYLLRSAWKVNSANFAKTEFSEVRNR